MSTTSLDAVATELAEARATGMQPPQQQQQQQQPPSSRGGSPDAAAAAAAAAAVAAAALPTIAEGDESAPAAAGGPGAEAAPGQQPMLDPRNLSLLVQLQHRWAGHRLRHQLASVASAAQGLGSSISTARSLVSAFHPFGEQWFLTEAGVVPPHELGRATNTPLSGASQVYSAANPGIINFHR